MGRERERERETIAIHLVYGNMKHAHWTSQRTVSIRACLLFTLVTVAIPSLYDDTGGGGGGGGDRW